MRCCARRDRRKVILATNVAETSLTVEGVTAVSTTGFARVPRFDAGAGSTGSSSCAIARASAEQRAGRAGRHAARHLPALWSRDEQRALSDPRDARDPARRPRPRRCCSSARSAGSAIRDAFPWLDAPPADGARRRRRRRCSRGSARSTRWARMTDDSAAACCALPRATAAGAHAASRVDRRDWPAATAALARRAGRRSATRSCPRPRARPRATFRQRAVERIRAARSGARGGTPASARGDVASAARSLRRAAGVRAASGARAGRAAGLTRPSEERLLRALLAGLPDRLARRREPGRARAVMVGGRGVQLADESGVADQELFVCVDLDAGGGRSVRARWRRRWNASGSCRERVSAESHGSSATPRRPRGARRRTLDWIAISCSTRPSPPARGRRRRGRAVLADAPRPRISRARCRPRIPTPGRSSRGPILCARGIPESACPLSTRRPRALLARLRRGRRSLAELPITDLAATSSTGACRGTSNRLEREAPGRIAVPSGSHMRLDTKSGPPARRSRRGSRRCSARRDAARRRRPRQGAPPPARAELPAAAGDRRPRELLERPILEVRKELRARYPRHAWPDDPLNAPPTARVKRRGTRTASHAVGVAAGAVVAVGFRGGALAFGTAVALARLDGAGARGVVARLLVHGDELQRACQRPAMVGVGVVRDDVTIDARYCMNPIARAAESD